MAAARIAARIDCRIFAARIVVGDDDAVGIFGGDRAHQGPLAGIAVAAGAEHHHQPAFGVRPQRLQRFCQRIGLVGVIDEDRRAVALGDPLEPALCPLEQFERGEYRLRLAAGADREPGRHQRILDLEFADQRQPHRIFAAAMFERQLLRKAVDVGANQANALAGAVALAADRDDPQFARPRRIDHLLRAVMIRRDHRGAVGRDQLAEQPQFCVRDNARRRDGNPCGRATDW